MHVAVDPAVKPGGELDGARTAYERGAWADAYAALRRADAGQPLGAEELELLATSAYMVGRDDELVTALERAHRAHLDAGETPRAVRCAFWIGMTLALRGELGGAGGWLSRAQRLLDRDGRDCAEHGYLLLTAVLDHEAAGDHGAAFATAAEAAAIGERFTDADLAALAVHEQGRALLRQGHLAEGLGLLDEAMVAVVAEQVSPMATGLLYCSVIDSCREVYALQRAQEWTVALSRWCADQPDMVAFSGVCLVHRAEILQLHGGWRDALDAVQRARERFAQGTHQYAAAEACYRQGEVHRLRGEVAAAEEAYREASRCGREPQPGLALLRLAQGNVDAALAAIRRVMAETPDRLERAELLPALVEILLAAGEVGDARAAAGELTELAGTYASEVLGAMAYHARGAVDLADEDPRAALVALRRAWQVWEQLDAPHEAARVRVLIGLACRALGDEDTAAWELDTARRVFARLGATPDVTRLDLLTADAPSVDAHGLTVRQLEVLRLVAAGHTNRVIAAQLVVSERTVDRHVSNIFVKLGVSSRSAATAYAYEHQLV
jgi:DNA-binding CsgD family transcriptional regulator